MSALRTYIENQNAWRRMFPRAVTPLRMPTTKAEADEIIEKLESDLSPENLCCDGELTGKSLRLKSEQLNAAYHDAVNIRSAL